MQLCEYANDRNFEDDLLHCRVTVAYCSSTGRVCPKLTEQAVRECEGRAWRRSLEARQAEDRAHMALNGPLPG